MTKISDLDFDAALELAAQGNACWGLIDQALASELPGAMEAASAVNDFAEATRNLLSAAADIRRSAENVERHIRQGYAVNSLGELQGSAPRFDILCALREASASAAKKSIRLAQRLNEEV